MGRFGHTENLWAVLVWAVLVHWPFWSFPFVITVVCPMINCMHSDGLSIYLHKLKLLHNYLTR